MTKVNWIAVDWGTTNCRVWIMDAKNEILATFTSDKGMGAISSDEYETVLLEMVAEYLADGEATPVLVCGMAGAQTGWCEAAYKSVPAKSPNISGSVKALTCLLYTSDAADE